SAYPAQISFKQEPLDFRRQGLSPCLSLLMSTFSLLITPPDASRPGFTVSTFPTNAFRGRLRSDGAISQNAPLPRTLLCILSFGSWLEPRYIFAAGSLI